MDKNKYVVYMTAMWGRRHGHTHVSEHMLPQSPAEEAKSASFHSLTVIINLDDDSDDDEEDPFLGGDED